MSQPAPVSLDIGPLVDAAIDRRLPSLEAAVARAAEAAVERASANRLVSIPEAAEYMGTTAAALRKAISRGHVQGVVRHGRNIRLRLGGLMQATGSLLSPKNRP